jgi:hypothetical protein
MQNLRINTAEKKADSEGQKQTKTVATKEYYKILYFALYSRK